MSHDLFPSGIPREGDASPPALARAGQEPTPRSPEDRRGGFDRRGVKRMQRDRRTIPDRRAARRWVGGDGN